MDARETNEGKLGSAALDALLRELARTPSGLPPADDPFLGKTLGRFVIEERIGAGGMGVVYRARDPKLARSVALKLVAPSLVGDERARARLLREARAAAGITHANIATVFDAGEEQGIPWIALELVEGLSLRQRITKDARPRVEEVRTVARGMAAALAAAHGAGVVHRDLKPDNVLLTHTAGVKVLDFGLARRLDDEGGGARATATLTREGDVLGTLGYLSPEQALGRPLDARSDVFSFGVVLYELLTGTLPFSARNIGEAAVALTTSSAAPLRELRPDVPRALVGLVERCLEREPGKRFADGKTLLAALDELRLEPEPDDDDTEGVTAARSVVPAVVPRAVRASVADAEPSEGRAEVKSRPSVTRRALVAAFALALAGGGVYVGSQWSSWMAPPEPPSLASIPRISKDGSVQRAFVMAVQSFYAADDAAAASALEDVLARAPDAVPALALRVAVGRPERGGLTREQRLDKLDAAARSAKDEHARAVGTYLAALWRLVNVDAEGQAISTDASHLLDEGERLLGARPDDYFWDLLLTASLPPSTLEARLDSLDALLARDPGPPFVWLLKAWSLQRANRGDEAGAVVMTALERHPANRVLRRERAFSIQGDPALAERELRLVLDEDPTDTYVRIELAGALLEQGKQAEWKRELDAILAGPSRPAPAGRAVLASVTSLTTRGQRKEARPLIERAWSVLVEAGRFDIAAGYLPYYAREALLMGDVDDATMWLGRMTELIARPELDDGARRRLQGEVLRLGGELDLARGDVDGAAEKAQRLAALDDTHFAPGARVHSTSSLAAAALAHRGDMQGALDAHERAFDGSERYPDDDEAALAALARLFHAAKRGKDASAAWLKVWNERERCQQRTLWWERVCRLYVVESAVARAELALADDDGDGARARLDELRAVWPEADDDVPLVVRARAVEAALLKPASRASARQR